MDNVILISALLLFVSIIAGKTSYRFGVPVLVLFLGIGMLAGSEGIGGIEFQNPWVAQFIGIIALNFILFSGGLDTSWPSIKPVLWQGVTLSTLGVLLTAFTLGFFIYYVTDFTIYESLLLGSIVSSTDAAAVFSILRSKNLALKSRTRPTLEFESGSNDPMAYMLTITFLGLVLMPDKSLGSVVPELLMQLIVGAVAGFAFGKLTRFIINRFNMDFEGLYPLLVIALMFCTFSVTNLINGNGFLAVYLSGLYIGNQELIHKRAIMKFYDGMAWLMQIILFLTLGLLVNPSEIIPVMGLGLMASAFLILVARPVSVFISLSFFKMKMRRRWYISWVGLRGAVPIVFATYPLLAGIDKANTIFNIVFFISLTSVLVQGTSIPIVAKWLNMVLPVRTKPRSPIDIFMSEGAKSEYAELFISEGNKSVGKRIVDIGFPSTAIVAMIRRGERFLTPNGTTVIEPNDMLMVLSETRPAMKQVRHVLDLPREAEEHDDN